MTNDKSPEQAAEEYNKTLSEWDLTLGGRGLQKRIFLAGYQRGKAEAEKRIYQACIDSPHSMPPVIKQIIFGGGDVD